MSGDPLKVVALPRKSDSWLAGARALALTTPGVLVLLVGLSLVLRTRILDAPFWIDEGISVGIASHPFTEIPGVLRQDGAPPLWYLLLHGWMELTGPSEVQTHVLSLIFALLCIPAAYWAAATTFGRREGRICACLAAVIPFLTAYAQETRMYTLVVLAAILATGAFLHAFVFERRRYVPVFFALILLLLYTHNWSVFFAVGSALALGVCLWDAPARGHRVRDAALGCVAVAIGFAPWVPSLLYQALHTGAPWSRTPSPQSVLSAPSSLLHGSGTATALLLAGGTGLAVVLRRRGSVERTAVLATITLGAGTVVTAWLASQVAAAWANRYLAVVLAPLLILSAVGLARAGRLGLVGLALVLLLWVTYAASDDKSNVKEIVAAAQPQLKPGDLVVSTHPEQIPVLHYYLPDGLRYATTLGPVANPRVMDWREAVERLEAAQPRATFERLLARQPLGSRVMLVMPVLRPNEERGWTAPWTELVRERTIEWGGMLKSDRRLKRIGHFASPTIDTFKPVRAVLYEKMAETPRPRV